PVSVPLLFLPLLLCSSSLSFGFVSAAGTADGSEEWESRHRLVAMADAAVVAGRTCKSLISKSSVVPSFMPVVFRSVKGRFGRRDRELPRDRTAGHGSEASELDMAAESRSPVCGESCSSSPTTRSTFVEDESLFVKTDWEAATDLTTLLKKLYDEEESRQRSPLFIVAESYGGKFAVTAGLSILKAIEAGELKLKLGAQVPRRLSMKIYPTYLSSKAASISTDISSLMNGAIKDKLKIIPETVSWGGQADLVFEALADDFMKPRINEVDELLALGINVTIYNGQIHVEQATKDKKKIGRHPHVLYSGGVVDLICATKGTESWVQKLKWEGLKTFDNMDRKPLYCDSEGMAVTKGFLKSYQNFHFYWILRAGHFVSVLLCLPFVEPKPKP
ncbi:hypothetical protein BHM03_00050641, partial [Ensete ventricosum]